MARPRPVEKDALEQDGGRHVTLRADLSGRRLLVTGASSGIGAATCRSIVGCGGAVAMLARRKDRLDDLARELGGRAVAVACDVTDTAALEAAADEAARTLGGLDGVVTVAGRTMVGSITSGTPQVWRELLDLNLVAALAAVRFAVAHFSGEGRRDVVVVASTGAITPLPNSGIYAASKRALQAGCDALRLELAAAGINVSCILPGMFETEALSVEGLIFDGEVGPDATPYFAGEPTPASAGDLGDAIAFVLSRPDGFAINELVVRPTGQLNP
ncbi:MAG TPA: SDR family NAD(P)-dependent oxidoreductase [Acidimicrobiales bacterium]|nr:SDR family NAD(P)-dependent oxidoreductase [Acidimicrobiales bacterium]